MQRVGEYIIDGSNEQETQTYPAHHTETQQPVLLKRYSGFATYDDRVRFISLVSRLVSKPPEHVAPICSVEANHDKHVYVATIIPPGVRLDQVQMPLPLDECVAIAQSLFVALGALHERGLMHLDLRPENIYWDLEQGVTLVRPCYIGASSHRGYSLDVWSRRVRYSAPEVIQSLVWPPQPASDWYSFGVLLWELTTGLPLFQEIDSPHAWAKAHLSQPWRPYHTEVVLPDPLLQLLHLLLRKSPVERQVSMNMVQNLLTQSLSPDLQLGTYQPTSASQRRTDYLAQMLVGRESLCSQLEKRLVNSRRHPVHFAILHGKIGVGRSALLRWYEAMVRQEQECILVTYSSSMGAGLNWEKVLLDALESTLLSMGRNSRERWISHMLSGPNFVLQALMAQSGFFDRLFRKRRSLSVEAYQRPTLSPPLEFVLLHALEAWSYACPDASMALTFDDVGFLEAKQLDLLGRWMGLLSQRGLVVRIVATIRDECLEEGTSQMARIQRMKALYSVELIEVEPLKEESVYLWILQFLRNHHQSISDHTVELIVSVTQGYPLMIHQALSWWRGKLEESVEGPCVEESELVQQFLDQFVGETMFSSIVERWKQLPIEMVDILYLCAAFKRSISEYTLATMLMYPVEKVSILLQSAIELGILYRHSAEVSFVHDVVRESFWETDRNRMLNSTLRLAELMLTQIPSLKEADELYVLWCADLILDLHHEGSKKYLDVLGEERVLECLGLATDFCITKDDPTTAASYGQLALEIDSKHITGKVSLVMQVATALARTQRPDQALDLLDRTLESHHHLQGLNEMYLKKLSILTLLSQYDMVVELIQDALRLFGEQPLDFECNDTHIKATFLETESLLKSLPSISALRDLDVLPEDHPKYAAQTFLAQLLPITYINFTRVFPLVTCRIFQLALNFGICPDSIRGFSTYAQILASDFGRYDEAFELGQEVLEMSLHEPFLRHRAIVCSDIANYISHWKRPIQHSRVLNKESHSFALHSGDIQYAGYSLMHDAYNQFSEGQPLENLNSFLTEARSFCAMTENQLAQDVLDGLALILRDDLKVVPEQGALPLEEDHESYLLRCVGHQNNMARALYAVGKMRVCMMAHKLQDAKEFGHVFMKYKSHIHGLFQEQEGLLLWALLCHQMSSIEWSEPNEQPGQLEGINALFETLSHSNPLGYHYRSLWLEASQVKDVWVALGKFESAYQLARKQAEWHDAAMIKEQCSRLLRQQGKTTLWLSYQEDARAMFVRWGAPVHINRLQGSMETTSLSIPSSMVSRPINRWNLAQLTQATMGLAQQKTLRQVSEMALPLLLNVSSASQAAIVFEHHGEMIHMISQHSHEKESTWLEGFDAILGANRVSMRILQAVADLNQEIVLANANKEGPFTHDAHIQNNRLCSILCCAVRRGKEPRVYVYLEHEEIPNLFTKESREQIHLLIAQLSWAIDKLE